MSAADAAAPVVPVSGAVTWMSQADADALAAAGGTTVGVPVVVPGPAER